MALTKENLSNRWWYRLTQVLSWVLIGFLFLGTSIFFWQNRPRISEYDSVYSAYCTENDFVYPVKFKGNNLVEYSEEKGSYYFDYDNDILNTLINDSCEKGRELTSEERVNIIKDSKSLSLSERIRHDYVLKVVEKHYDIYYGSWSIFIVKYLGSLIVLLVILKLISKAFHYILLGKNNGI